VWVGILLGLAASGEATALPDLSAYGQLRYRRADGGGEALALRRLKLTGQGTAGPFGYYLQGIV